MAELLAGLDSRELTEWQAYCMHNAQEAARKGGQAPRPGRGDALMHNL